MFDWILKLSVRNSVFVNLTFALVVFVGIASARRLAREEFPEISLDRVIVTTTYPGATASDVEELITKPLEDALDDVNDIEKVTSTSQEGASSIIITFLDGTDLQFARSEVEKSVASVEDLPETSETPIVRELKLEIPVVSIALIGDPGATQLVEDLADEFRDLDGVAAVNITGVAERTIFVDLDETQLRALKVQPGEVAAAIQAAQANVPAGSVELGGNDIFVKTEQRLQSAADVARIPLPIRGRPQGSSLRIGDIAEVKMVADPNDTEVLVNDQPGCSSTRTSSSRATTSSSCSPTGSPTRKSSIPSWPSSRATAMCRSWRPTIATTSIVTSRRPTRCSCAWGRGAPSMTPSG